MRLSIPLFIIGLVAAALAVPMEAKRSIEVKVHTQIDCPWDLHCGQLAVPETDAIAAIDEHCRAAQVCIPQGGAVVPANTVDKGVIVQASVHMNAQCGGFAKYDTDMCFAIFRTLQYHCRAPSHKPGDLLANFTADARCDKSSAWLVSFTPPSLDLE